MSNLITVPVSERVPAGTFAQARNGDGLYVCLGTTPPIDLEPGDLLLMNSDTGYLLRVTRDDVVILERGQDE
jgi:hypothetical protein